MKSIAIALVMTLGLSSSGCFTHGNHRSAELLPAAAITVGLLAGLFFLADTSTETCMDPYGRCDGYDNGPPAR